MLRWLIKKLKVQTKEPKLNYKIEGQSWALLSILLDRIPPRTLATILTEGKFFVILHSSLDGLDGLIKQELETASQGGIAASSVASLGSKKRKRTEGSARAGSPQLDPATFSSPVEGFLSLLSAVRQLLMLQDRIPSTQSAVRSHIKLVLRGEPASAANLLASTFRCATLVIRSGQNEGQDSQRLFFGLLSLLDIWSMRLDSPNDDASVSSGHLLSHCGSSSNQLHLGFLCI